MLRDFSKRLIQKRFWLSRWTVTVVTLLIAGMLAAWLLSGTEIDFDTALNYVALGILIFVFVTLFYGIIAIHDVPYEIAKHRGHPQQDAIHAAGWVSLFTLHAIWPFLWIWAMLYRPDRGWGFQMPAADTDSALHVGALRDLARRVEALETRQITQKRDDLERWTSRGA